MTTKEQPAPHGVIDFIADGLSLALARPLLLFLPMLLDLYLWAGWRVSVRALTDPIADWLLRQDVTGSADWADWMQTAGRSDLLALLALFAPSLLSGVGRDEIYHIGSRPQLASGYWFIDILLVGAVIAGAALLMMAYSIPLADAAMERSRSIRDLARSILTGWLRFSGLLLIAAGALLLLLGPFLVATAILLLAGVPAEPLLQLAGFFIGVFAYLVLVMSWDAIAVDELGPLSALRNGYRIVRAQFWPTIGLAGAWLLIVVGLSQVWLRIADTAPGLLIGVVANSFFASGLAIASMLFYSHRNQSLSPGRAR